ncbi:MAG: hypothetical protein LBJ12_02360 [Oscillospiraceae bacterium]|jgi:hypothetical protein|nr:hypothetical protein [Oscillospiraceae bacterium]
MYAITPEVQTALSSETVTYQFRFGDLLDNESLVGANFKLDRAIGDKTIWLPGSCQITTCEFTAIANDATDLEGQKQTLYIGVAMPDGSPFEIPMGVFTIVSAVKSSRMGFYDCKLEDNIRFLDTFAELAIPAGSTFAQVGALLQEQCALKDLTLVLPETYLIDATTAKDLMVDDASLRQLLSMYAQLICGWVEADREGNIVVRRTSGQQHSLSYVRDAGTFDVPTVPGQDAGTFTEESAPYYDAGFFLDGDNTGNMVFDDDNIIDCDYQKSAIYYQYILDTDNTAYAEGLAFDMGENQLVPAYADGVVFTELKSAWLEVAALAAYIPAEIQTFL